MPHMQDPYFGRSVILICEHNKDGTMGLIINKPFEGPEIQDLFENLFTKEEDFLQLIPKIFFGGPVLVERGIVLHPTTYQTDGTVKLSKDFSMTSNREILQDIAIKKGPSLYKLMLGHAGWASNQLEREIENGDWLLQSATSDYIFNTPVNDQWDSAVNSFGIDMSHISGRGGVA
ncbi:MAG: YqgE/AlgH family protein [Candidatus Marinimicrobia bacterium]|jgi:putative transcriptional regulator|nr:YqgE/AlgH family protein [Candidatus Neomarinimicrobiota bacterium]